MAPAKILSTSCLLCALLLFPTLGWGQVCRSIHSQILVKTKGAMGHRDAQALIQRAGNDPEQFWRLFYTALTSERIPYSVEYSQALLEDLFAASHALFLPSESRQSAYDRFRILWREAFEVALKREALFFKTAKENEEAERPVQAYFSQPWFPILGGMKAEASLRQSWREKVTHPMMTPQEAETAGRELAAFLRKSAQTTPHTLDRRLFARLNFIVFSHFQASQPSAFFGGFVDSGFANAYHQMEPPARELLMRGMRTAEQRHQIQIELPWSRKQSPKSLRGMDRLRDALYRSRTPVQGLVRIIEEEAQNNAKIFVDLFSGVLREGELDVETRRLFVERIFKSAQSRVFSKQDQFSIWDSLQMIPAFGGSHDRWLWGTTSMSPGAEEKLRLYLKNLNSALNASAEDKSLAFRRGKYLEKFIQELSKSDEDLYPRLLYIVLSERKFTNGTLLIAGMWKQSDGELLAGLKNDEPFLIEEGIQIFENKYQISTSELPALAQDPSIQPLQKIGTRRRKPIQTAIVPEENEGLSQAEEVSPVIGRLAVRNFIQAMNLNRDTSKVTDVIKVKDEVEDVKALQEVGRDFAQIIESAAQGDPLKFMRMVAIAIKENPYPLHPVSHAKFREKLLRGAQILKVPSNQQQFLYRILTKPRSEVIELLEDSGLLEEE